jgi:hypothetical protein
LTFGGWHVERLSAMMSEAIPSRQAGANGYLLKWQKRHLSVDLERLCMLERHDAGLRGHFEQPRRVFEKYWKALVRTGAHLVDSEFE